jgi:hypothetical protein
MLRLAIAAVFVLALGAKEMAVAIPGILVAYEVIEWRGFQRARAAFLALLCLMSLLFAWGRTHGPEALADKPGYAMKPRTMENYLGAQGRHMQDYFFQTKPRNATTAAVILLALAVTAALLRSRVLAFATVFILLSPLAIAFVDRAGGALYLPYYGWCLFAAALLHHLTQRVPHALWAGAAVLAYLLISYNYESWIHEKPAMLTNGDVTWRMINDLNRLRPPIRPGAKLYVEKNPFEGWDLVFILMVWADVKPIDFFVVDKNAPEGAATPGLTGILSLDAAGHLTWRTP